MERATRCGIDVLPPNSEYLSRDRLLTFFSKRADVPQRILVPGGAADAVKLGPLKSLKCTAVAQLARAFAAAREVEDDEASAHAAPAANDDDSAVDEAAIITVMLPAKLAGGSGINHDGRFAGFPNVPSVDNPDLFVNVFTIIARFARHRQAIDLCSKQAGRALRVRPQLMILQTSPPGTIHQNAFLQVRIGNATVVVRLLTALARVSTKDAAAPSFSEFPIGAGISYMAHAVQFNAVPRAVEPTSAAGSACAIDVEFAESAIVHIDFELNAESVVGVLGSACQGNRNLRFSPATRRLVLAPAFWAAANQKTSSVFSAPSSSTSSAAAAPTMATSSTSSMHMATAAAGSKAQKKTARAVHVHVSSKSASKAAAAAPAPAPHRRARHTEHDLTVSADTDRDFTLAELSINQDVVVFFDHGLCLMATIRQKNNRSGNVIVELEDESYACALPGGRISVSAKALEPADYFLKHSIGAEAGEDGDADE